MSNSDPSVDKERRIIVDEDWKAQVEREKATQRTSGNSPGNSSHDERDEGMFLPPANFSGIVSMFASQAMAAMGMLPEPMSGEGTVNRSLAKFLIDTLGILEQKTEGNRTVEESTELRDALHHLRMIYVATPTVQKPNTHGKSASTIELP